LKVEAAIILAIIGGVVAVCVAALNARAQRRLEALKIEGAFILEAIKTNSDHAQALKNLKMLVKTGLVSETRVKLETYLEGVSVEDRAVLPAIVGNFALIDPRDIAAAEAWRNVKNPYQRRSGPAEGERG
jgi:hypothetical protein